jgi:hypothetical protein
MSSKSRPLWKQTSIPEPYLSSFGVPSKGALPWGPPHWAFWDRDASFLEPL